MANRTAAAVPLDAATEPVTVDISQLTQRCENLTRAGSRIVVAQRCWSAGNQVEDEEALSRQLEQVRRDQEELERRQRDIEEQRRQRL